MPAHAHPSMTLTDFRNRLTEVVNQLTEPLHLTSYTTTVAELRPMTPAFRRREAQRLLDLVHDLDDLEIPDLLVELGIDGCQELMARHKEMAAHGVTFSAYPQHVLPGDGSVSTIDEYLAHWFFEEYLPPTDLVPWFKTLAAVQETAHGMGLDPTLPFFGDENEEDGRSNAFIRKMIAAGYTPQTFGAYATEQLAANVPLHLIDDTLGEGSVPNDVASLPYFKRTAFDLLKETGLPHVEAVAVYRDSITDSKSARAAYFYLQAGADTARRISSAFDRKIDPDMAARADREGMPYEEWIDGLEEIARHPYKHDGVLPVSLLVHAQRAHKLSLARWDNAPLPVAEKSADGLRRQKRLAMYPWNLLYPDHVLELAREAGLGIGYASEAPWLVESAFKNSADGAALKNFLITAYRKGLSQGVAKALRQKLLTVPPSSLPQPEQLLNLLDQGVRGVLAERLVVALPSDPREWESWVRTRMERHQATDAFIDDVLAPLHDPMRTAVGILASAIEPRRLRGALGNPQARVILQTYLDGDHLTDVELRELLGWCAETYKGSYQWIPQTQVMISPDMTRKMFDARDAFDRLWEQH